ncbi:helicase C-terminal domain-containing protein [Baekduia sp. Peel2402]|uniref:helicase C-terminal domain-containing protein n=1 Tax=Baekduia sp. Peel2402 TaxID=3458296 RepID=UPI00403E8034
MPIDFSKIGRSSVSDTVTEPRRIFSALSAKDEKYSYARDVQSQVWSAWHPRRAERDLVVKMNTGGGKTVVGLIMLKSCLNEDVGPVVYLTPDNYLAGQVRREAAALGLQFTEDPESRPFLQGRAILIVNVHTLFNGKSKFGVKGAQFRTPIELGAVLIDDAHACMATVTEQFTLRIPSTHAAHTKLIKLFEPDLVAQSLPGFKDLEQDDRSALMAVPPWAWTDKQAAVLDILHPHRDDKVFQWPWPLLVDSLGLCRVAMTPSTVEIAPPCLPMEMLPSFADAKRRIYLTATLADDSVLITEFDADPDSVRRPVTPESADDLGERMILSPQESFPEVAEEDIHAFLVEQAKTYNVVVIVPSKKRLAVWEPLAAETATAKELDDVLEKLREGHVGLVVLVSKYDGIDLPDDACRVLVLDGLPEARDPLERVDSDALGGSDVTLMRQVQRIEQGMGRGVRSNKDYCVVMLLGSKLTARLNTPKARAMLSPATRAQLALSDKVADMLEGEEFGALEGLVEQCLKRDPEWVSLSRDALDGLTYEKDVAISDVALAQRAAFDLAGQRRFAEASERLRMAFGAAVDVKQRGRLKEQAAAYLHAADPVAAQKLQLSAVQDNRAAARPVDGVSYKPLKPIQQQGKVAAAFLRETYDSPVQLILGVKELLADLVPSEDEALVNPFEEAVLQLGLHLGFNSERPERDIGNGPDDLWSIGNNKYLVIECKSAALADEIPRRDIEQLGQSLDWFDNQFDNTMTATGIMIHPSRQLHAKATAPAGSKIITFAKLEQLRDTVTAFTRAIAKDDNYKDADAVAERLQKFHLTGGMFVGHWTEAPRSTSRR